MRGQFRHFRDARLLTSVLNEIRDRHRGGSRELARIIVSGLTHYWHGCHQSGTGSHGPYVIGLSGGVDSSLVAALAVMAVGAENVLAVTLPAREDDDSVAAAARVRGWLNLMDAGRPSIIDLASACLLLRGLIDQCCDRHSRIDPDPTKRSESQRLREGNLASRMRIAVIYDLAHAYRGRVLGTANRTEYLIGYAAKFGTPMSYDLGVLDDLFKVEVVDLAKHLAMPTEIVNRVPSTGYYHGQTHEAELGASYDELDAACYLLFHKRLDISTIVKDYRVDREFLVDVRARHDRAAHKRRLRPEHVHVSDSSQEHVN